MRLAGEVGRDKSCPSPGARCSFMYGPNDDGGMGDGRRRWELDVDNRCLVFGSLEADDRAAELTDIRHALLKLDRRMRGFDLVVETRWGAASRRVDEGSLSPSPGGQLAFWFADEWRGTRAERERAFRAALRSIDFPLMRGLRELPPDLRPVVLCLAERDRRGYVIQLVHSQPGLLAAVQAAILARPAEGAEIERCVLDGVRQRTILDRCVEAVGLEGAEARRFRWLARRPEPAFTGWSLFRYAQCEFVMDDRPEGRIPLLRWLWRVEAARRGPEGREQASDATSELERYVSRHWLYFGSELTDVDISDLQRFVRERPGSARRNVEPHDLVARTVRWGRERNRRDHLVRLGALGELDYPQPPFPAFASSKLQIEPITEAIGLHDEAARMHHCVFESHQGALVGALYVYTVRYRGQAYTMELTAPRREMPEWALRQLAGPYNADPPGELFDLVNRWLEWSARRGARSV